LQVSLAMLYLTLTHNVYLALSFAFPVLACLVLHFVDRNWLQFLIGLLAYFLQSVVVIFSMENQPKCTNQEF